MASSRLFFLSQSTRPIPAEWEIKSGRFLTGFYVFLPGRLCWPILCCTRHSVSSKVRPYVFEVRFGLNNNPLENRHIIP